MIKQRNTEFGSLPGGNPDTAYSEYLRGKLEVRNHSAGKFTPRGNDVWAERSGRTYHGTAENLSGSGVDYSSPVAGFGMGKLSALTGGGNTDRIIPKSIPKVTPEMYMKGGVHSAKAVAKTVPKALVPGLMSLASEVKARGGAVDALEIKELMQRGANRARGTVGAVGGRKPNPRAAIVKKIMKERGVSLPEASKIVKAEGLY